MDWRRNHGHNCLSWSSSGPTLIELSQATIEMPLRLRCKTFRAAEWLSVIRSTIYSMVIASRMLVAAL